MKTCPEYKSLVDRCGDLDSIQKEGLDNHLASCGDCAQYKSDADRTMKLLRAMQKHPTITDPIDQAFARLSKRLAASKRQMVLALVLVAAVIAAPFALMLRGALSPVVWGLLVVSLVAAAFGVWHIRRGQSAMLNLAERAGGFYATWRRDLENGIRILVGGGVLAIVSCIGFLSFSILGPFGVVERLVVLSAAFLTAFAALHTFVVELPQLRGELRLVRNASGG